MSRIILFDVWNIPQAIDSSHRGSVSRDGGCLVFDGAKKLSTGLYVGEDTIGLGY
jgi:hypothetical protein